jgi:hypothetical protein
MIGQEVRVLSFDQTNSTKSFGSSKFKQTLNRIE